MARAARVALFNARGRSGSIEGFRLISADPDVEQVFILEQRAEDALGVERWEEVSRFSTEDQASGMAKVTSTVLASLLAALT